MSSEGRTPAFDAAYQGAPGAYSEEAARTLTGGSTHLLPLPSLEQVFAAAQDRRANAAVVPIENSLAGSVPNVYELLLDSALSVTGETLVAIDHVLVAPASTRRLDVRRVLSHPVALAQCRDFFRRHAQIEPVAVFDTAGAVAEVMHQCDGRSAAIASRRAAALHGALILEEQIQDHPENWTRFLRLSVTPSSSLPDTSACKALIAFGLPHIPGALARALMPLGECGVNLTRIESRAIHGRPFEYRFIVEIAAPTGRDLNGALDALAPVTVWRRLAGVYTVMSADAAV